MPKSICPGIIIHPCSSIHIFVSVALRLSNLSVPVHFVLARPSIPFSMSVSGCFILTHPSPHNCFGTQVPCTQSPRGCPWASFLLVCPRRSTTFHRGVHPILSSSAIPLVHLRPIQGISVVMSDGDTPIDCDPTGTDRVISDTYKRMPLLNALPTRSRENHLTAVQIHYKPCLPG